MMSTPESVAPVAAVEEVKTDMSDMPAMPAMVVDKAAEPAAAVPEPSPAVEAATAQPMATEDPAMSESKADEPKMGEREPKMDVTKNPSFLTKLLSSFKAEKKAKAPKSPKKEAEEAPKDATATMEVPKDTATMEAPKDATATMEAPKDTATMEAPMEASAPVVVAELATASEVPEVMETVPIKTKKMKRRISARVGEFFKSKPKIEVTTPAKVDEHPPMIGEPEAMAPLENPASEAGKAVDGSAPVVAATA